MAFAIGLTAFLTFCLTCLPGWLVASRARLPLGQTLAAGFASTFAVLTITALLSELVGYLPPWSTAPVAVAISLAIWLGARDRPVAVPRCPTILLLIPAAMALHGYAAYRLGFGVDQHPAVFRAWYNADWFKHLGHANALVNFGLPARDIFGGGARLHYYWLFYLLPAVGGSIHGDVAAALLASNLVLVFFFWLLVTGFLKALGLPDGKAVIMTLLGWTVFTMDGLLEMLPLPADAWLQITTAMTSPGELAWLNTFLPQHLLMIAGFLSFGLLWSNSRTGWTATRWLSLAPVVAAGAMSTLMGATAIATAAIAMLLAGPGQRHVRIVAVAVAGSAALALVLVLQVVDFSFGSGAVSSPAFGGGANEASLLGGLLAGIHVQWMNLGLALPLGVWGLVHGLRQPSDQRLLVAFCALMFVVAMGVTVGSEGLLDNLRFINELRYRNSYPICVALLGGMALLIRDLPSFGHSARSVMAMFALMIITALPSNILHLVWQGWAVRKWQVVVPDEDMRALRWLAAHSGARDMVLQYPEPIYLMNGGRDTWVPIFAGRAVPGSYRSTVWRQGERQVAVAQRFYGGRSQAVPLGVDWIYLSRVLHPHTYDALVHRMTSDPGWTRAYCLADACLFRRVPSGGTR